MAGSRVPGPLSLETLTANVDDGTLARMPSPKPGPTGTLPSPLGPSTTPQAQPAQSAAKAVPDTIDSDIEVLDLAETAKKAAYSLKKAHPAVVFTSGRRDKNGQASAMASNVVKNRKWIAETYASTEASKACQKWVDDNPKVTTQTDIAAGLLTVLDSLTDSQLGALSKHLSGEAFDVQPVEKDADKIKETIRGLTGLNKFLEKEGGLVRWHAQF